MTVNVTKPEEESLQVISPEVVESEEDLLRKRGIKMTESQDNLLPWTSGIKKILIINYNLFIVLS